MGIAAIIVLVATGAIVGLSQGLLGVGGAFIMVPVMIIVFNGMDVPSEAAVKLAFGTSLMVVLPTAVFSSFAHHRRGGVWWKAAAVLGCAGAAGAVLGATLTTQVLSETMAKVIFGAVAILGAARMILWKPPDGQPGPDGSALVWAAWGLPLGVFTGMLGVGGGILMVPLMVTVLRFGMHRAVGTSTAVMLFTSGAGALAYIVHGLDTPGLPGGTLGYFHLPAWLCLASTSLVMT
ncbi:MAG: sulfite exporter TauE/SafE family protein, partial [Chloroflexi bacterium]|nr:sulfite exporter TauE/SafE family protein [Chloroflexota bacterium]